MTEFRRNCQHGTGEHVLTAAYNVIHTSFDRPAASDGSPVPPSKLLDFRDSHVTFGPSCLCPRAPGETMVFIESAIVVGLEEPWCGQYLALCASGACDYVGEIIHVWGDCQHDR